jgi:predicted enzyme related to lactoylglutathione lyase
MDVDSYEPGVPSWLDLGTPDPKKAAKFYSSLFGWDVQEGPPESGGYAIAHLRGKAVAGLGPQQNPGPPVWTTYINVDSADDTVAKVKANGGMAFMEPFDVMDVGRMAIVADRQGAVLGLWQPKAHKGAGIVNEPGTFSWAELTSDDIEGAKKYYEAVFGWGAETHGEGQGSYTEWKLGGRSIGGAMPKPPGMPAEVPPHWNVYFSVADADEAVKKIEALGGSVVMAPFEIEPGRMAVVGDDQGSHFNVITLKEGVGSS